MTARNADEIEISAVERIGGEGGRGYPSQDPSSAFDGKEDPHHTGRFSGRGEHRLAVLPRRYRGEPVLQLVEGVSGSVQGRLAGDTAREATSQEVKMLRAEARALKDALAEKMLENHLLKKA